MAFDIAPAIPPRNFASHHDYIAAENEYGASNYKPLDVVLSRGEGVWLWDVDGNRYLDCLAGYSAVNHGHCHPKIREALVAQASQLALTSRAFRNDQLGPFCEEVCRLTRSTKVLPMNTGAEAVETAIKIARKWGYKVKGVAEGQAEIVVFENNFHGRTVSVVSFSTDPTARKDFGPFTAGFKIVPFGDLEALEAAVTPNTVAVLMEPIQGEAGVILPPPGYMRAARELCARERIIFILDEIQTGLGRAGTLLAEEHEGVESDMTLLGKALGGGFYPISAVLTSEPIMGVLRPGEHGSTFGGNPLACAVARASLRVTVEDGLIENSVAMGAYFSEGLRAIGSRFIKEVRGRGLMLAAELHPDAGGARRFCVALKHRGILCKDTREHTIRISPPLVITREDIDFALAQFASVLA
jgi:ornithine--oxo-acid transaminase